MTDRHELSRRRALAIVVIAAAVAYLPGLWNDFAYDDVALISHNPRVQSIGNLFRIFAWPYWGVSGSENAIYRPLTTITFLIDWVVSRGYPSWFHFTNLAWNAAACGAAFLLLDRFYTRRAAVFGALVFALHPVHVEAVANVVGRAEMIASVFVFTACVLWVRRDSTDPRLLAGVLALFTLALLAKESSAVLPALLVLIDFGRWRLALRDLAAYFRREWLLVVGCTIVLAGYVAARYAVLGRFGPTLLDPALDGVSGDGHRVLTALQAWPEFLRLAFFPRTLLADYSPRIITPADSVDARVLLGAAILAFLLVGSIVAAQRGERRTAIGLMWFPLAILPVSNLLFPIGIVVAERTLYLPLFALAMLAAGVAELAAERSIGSARARLIAAGVVLALLSTRTLLRIPEWESTNSIFFALRRDRPDAFRAHWHLAREARRANDLQASVREYTTALELWPYREGLVAEAAGTLVMAKRLEDANKVARFGAERWPRNIAIQRLLAATALDLGDTTAARAAMKRGLSIDPGDAMLTRMRTALEPRGEHAR